MACSECKESIYGNVTLCDHDMIGICGTLRGFCAAAFVMRVCVLSVCVPLSHCGEKQD